MVQNIYSEPTHNLNCSSRFTCGAAECPEVIPETKPPSCHIDKFKRYQPDTEIWYRKDWDEVNRITWREVFSLQASWIYVLLAIIILVFVFMSMILIKLLLDINRYY
ncbi:MAG: hypothetical protein FIB08_08710 [Candidatus Methanoperedens sp.]|nr:hypothetical protein [Candidatus Methanoperedens sp.]